MQITNNNTSSSGVMSKADYDFMSNFSLNLIHKVLLTDPRDFAQLTMNGLPKPKQVFFHTFVQNRGFPLTSHNNDNLVTTSSSSSSIEEQLSKTMHRAYNDIILNDIQNVQKSYKPLQGIILEIHSILRSLLPNRPDLHSHVKDEDVINNEMDSFEKVGTVLKIVADALCMLESEYRAESTKQWLNDILLVEISNCKNRNDTEQGVEEGDTETLFIKETTQKLEISKPMDSEGSDNNDNNDDTFSMTHVSFAFASAAFLHYKAELCQAETADFQLGHILAPKLNKMGKDYIKQKFNEQFNLIRSDNRNGNDGDLESNLPNTIKWIQEMTQNTSNSVDELLASEELRGNMILQTGWIDNILFRSPRSVTNEGDTSSSAQLLMPEVLWLDSRTIQSIRMTTKISVVGSVLALHAASAAGVSDNVFKQNPLDRVIEESRIKLTRSMEDGSLRQEDYENNIADAVVNLAKALNLTWMNNDSIQSLRNRTKTTLRGDDPVIKLLDNRMKNIFRDLMMTNNLKTYQAIPTSLKTGRQACIDTSISETSIETFDLVFKNYAKTEFIAKGFAFYSNELAESSILAFKTINLVLAIYGRNIIDKLFIVTYHQST